MKRFDLNLLRVFDALMRERSVSRAGIRMGLTQSGISHALNRLRALVQDPLFIRVGDRMQPTALADELAQQVGASLSALQTVLTHRQFDPGQTSHQFTIASADLSTIILLPALGAELTRTAPNVSLNVRPIQTTDVIDELKARRLDMAIAPFTSVPSGYASMHLFDDDFVCVMRRRHPLARTKLTIEALRGTAHLEVVLSPTIGTMSPEIVNDRGLKRRVALDHSAQTNGRYQPKIMMTVPNFIAAPAVLATSDMVATLPRRLTNIYCANHNFVVRPLPYKTPVLRVSAVWHPALANQGADIWFRKLLAQVAEQLPRL